jgi:hypothetical protein
MIGAVRFNRFDKKWKYGVIGYEFHPTFWGRGLMTEALRVVVPCGHRGFGLTGSRRGHYRATLLPTVCLKKPASDTKEPCGSEAGSREHFTISACSAG